MTSSHLNDAARLLDVYRRLDGAEADALCGRATANAAMSGPISNGYRHRDFDTRAATIDVAIPKLRQGSYFPTGCCGAASELERALTSVVATCYLLGVSTAGWAPGRNTCDKA